MPWLFFFAALTLLGVFGTVVNVNRVRFERLAARETSGLTAVATMPGPYTQAAELPTPVARYRQLAVGNRLPVATLRLRHGGTFALSPTSKPLPIEGTQLFTADPPAFLWRARIHMAPGVWIDARDMTLEGRGSMRVLLDDTITIADSHGAQMDQGSALRLLAEMVWYPTALFDARYVTWAPIDDGHARATLRIRELQVSGVFEFGADGLPARMTAERYNDKSELKSWGGIYRSYENVSGMLVPFEAEVAWQLETGSFTYAHWFVVAAEYDVPGTFAASKESTQISPVMP